MYADDVHDMYMMCVHVCGGYMCLYVVWGLCVCVCTHSSTPRLCHGVCVAVREQLCGMSSPPLPLADFRD